MTNTFKSTRPVMRILCASLIASGTLLISGCAAYNAALGGGENVTASDKTRMTKSGFLTNYAKLQAMPDGNGVECWRDTSLDAKKYDKVLVPRIVVSLAPPVVNKDAPDSSSAPVAPPVIDPADLVTLTEYFQTSITKALKPQMAVVDKAGPGVVVMRIALTNLIPTSVARSVTGTLIPYAFIAEAGSGVATGRPAGSTPYMGETSMEMQFLDGATTTVIAECRDTEIGRKYATDADSGMVGGAQTWASGYMNSFQSWAYAKNAMDKWSLLIAKRFAVLRGVTPPKP